jgi:hypothetical protein
MSFLVGVLVLTAKVLIALASWDHGPVVGEADKHSRKISRLRVEVTLPKPQLTLALLSLQRSTASDNPLMRTLLGLSDVPSLALS